MTGAAAAPRAPHRPGSGLRAAALWAAALGAVALLRAYGEPHLGWAIDYPKAWRIPLARWIGEAMRWLTEEAAIGPVSVMDVTRFIADVVDLPYRIALGLLATGLTEGQGSAAVVVVPPLSWIAVTGVVALLALHAGGLRLAALAGGCFLFVALFGQWQPAMVTLASILVAVPAGVAGGLLLGILGHRSRAVERALTPVLDLMQTVPVFAYLLPILVLFGFSPTAAVIATIVYALPPMTRVAMLALRSVPQEVVELGRMTGCTRRQMTWRVMVPSARADLMVGVNQVIMLSLNMVIIASMIGAGGLGFEVLAALRRLDIGAGLEAGLAIVAIAIALDRLSQALAARRPTHAEPGRGLIRRHPYALAAVALVAVTAVAGLWLGWVRTYPAGATVSTGPATGELMRWINVTFFDQLEAIKTALLLNVLVPVKRFMLAMPWAGVAGLLALAGWRLGGPRLALAVGLLASAVAATGQWEKAMVTVYLCGVSVVLAALIGIPVGILAAESARAGRVIRVAIDTLQTLPSFVYLMPFVMLFRVGDFTAMLAVVAYAVAPAVRYTAHGIARVDPRLVEAGRAAGCTPWQLLAKVKLRLALPEILLGINQTIMLALSMLVITALVGTRDLGQEVYIALTKADTGRGITAGLAVAAIAIIADRLVTAAAARTRARLGLER